ncbi:heavy metal translocating P-type ATPase [Piscinibacter sakaiensis]|uniref:heavy metal translocating P-type ATPase n=1 Tax=Piscinibacter sakaiensis TaxID=1547922 RepID=UPI003AADDF64
MSSPPPHAPLHRIAADEPTGGLAGDAVSAIDDPVELARYTHWQQAADGQQLATSQLQISGIYCAACAGGIEAALRAVPGVVDAKVNAASARAEVVWQPSLTRPSRLIAAVRAIGYDAAPDLAAPARQLRLRESRQACWRLFVAGFCMMQVMMYATPVYLAKAGELPADQLRLLHWAGWLLTLPVLLFSARPLFAGAWQSVRRCRIAMDVPVVLGLLIAFIASSGATFDPGGIFGHEVYYDSVTMFVFLLLGARSLELRARHQAALALEGGAVQLPDRVERLAADGSGEFVHPARLAIGDRVKVLAGQLFPADGRVRDGRTQADESLLSGESAAVAKQAGDEVLAGSINLRAPVLIEVERVGADTRHDAVIALMRQAASERPQAMRAVDRLAAPFLWLVLLLAAAAALVWSMIDPSRVVWVAVSVLIVTCPCALSLATPSVLLAAGGALTKVGLLPRRLGTLEQLATIDTIVFDKTGTLTDDRLRIVGHCLPAAGVGECGDDLLGAAASLAAWSSHPASRALVDAAAASGEGRAAIAWTDIEELAGEGVQARDEGGRIFRLGREQWVAAASSVKVDAGHRSIDDRSTSVAFGPLGAPAIRFELAETLRDGAIETVRLLQSRGLQLLIASGDQPGRVAHLADRLGISDARGGLRPHDKLALLDALQAQGRRVLMIGDGLNDAPVLAKADVSIALGHGSQLSQLQSDAVLLSARLGAIDDARQIALRARHVIRQNLGWALAYNLTCIPLALAGFLPPWAAGAGMAGSSLLVALNALRAGRLPASSQRSLDHVAAPARTLPKRSVMPAAETLGAAS